VNLDIEGLAEALEATRVEVLDAEALEARHASPVPGAHLGPGAGKSEIVLRLLSQFEGGGPGDPTEWAVAVRNALVHEGRLWSVVVRNYPSLDVDSFLALLVAAFSGLRVPTVGSPSRQFTEAELAELSHEGVEISDAPTSRPGAAAKTAAEYAALLATALSVGQTAELLHVDESRVRQRLTQRTLYGVKTGATWRLFRFQFARDGQVPRIDPVLQVLPMTLHPVAVYRWFTSPIADLELDGLPTSPVDWLAAGGDPAPVVEIARDL
jgi:hypothetical protein